MPLTVLMPMRTPVKLPGPVVTASALKFAGHEVDLSQHGLRRAQQILRLPSPRLPRPLGEQLSLSKL